MSRERDALVMVQMALDQHSEGPKVASMRVAGNGPTIGELVARALSEPSKSWGCWVPVRERRPDLTNLPFVFCLGPGCCLLTCEDAHDFESYSGLTDPETVWAPLARLPFDVSEQSKPGGKFTSLEEVVAREESTPEGKAAMDAARREVRGALGKPRSSAGSSE